MALYAYTAWAYFKGQISVSLIGLLLACAQTSSFGMNFSWIVDSHKIEY